MTALEQLKGLIDVLNNMPPEQKAKMLKNHQDFHRLFHLCTAKKYIEPLPHMSGLVVLEMTKEVQELKTLYEFLKPGGFQWKDSDKISS